MDTNKPGNTRTRNQGQTRKKKIVRGSIKETSIAAP